MFEHDKFDIYKIDEIPLDQDMYLMDEIHIKEYEEYMLKVFNEIQCDSVGRIAYIACRKVNENSVELTWYPDTYSRFHQVSVLLPKEQVILCVGSWQWDEKPHIFVKSGWLEDLYMKLYSVFCMIDAIDVKKALEKGSLSRELLLELRNEIDSLANEYPEVIFISFADSIILKANWTVGTYKSEVSYTYNPEIFIEILIKMQGIYRKTLNLDVYAILTQGANEYYDDELLHTSDSGNHISLNSLGIPFADLMSIDDAVRQAVKNKHHGCFQLYSDGDFYHSLKLNHDFDKNSKSKYPYQSKMKSEISYYYPNDFNVIKNALNIDA